MGVVEAFMVRQGRELGRRYRLDGPLGRGGMGEVWRAVDLRLDRPVAVKLLPLSDDTDPALVARFRREAQLAAGLQHPGITVVHDIDQDGPLLFLVMELLNGRDLRRVLSEHPGGLPLARAVHITAQVASALGAAHARGVVHRDVKPSNLIEADGGWTKICDFGIARFAETSTNLTGGSSLGTPAYMAPEQFEGHAVDGRTDLYSLGCVLYELLTGRPPFPSGKGLSALLYHHLHKTPDDPRMIRPDLPAELCELVLNLLAKRPADRVPDAETVLLRLRPSGAGRASSTSEAPVEEWHRTGLELFGAKDYAGALPFFQSVLAERTRRLGTDHEETLTSCYLVAATLYYLDREVEALPLAEQVLAARIGLLGPEHPTTLNVHHLIAAVRVGLGRTAEALPGLLYVTDGRSRVLGPYHEDAVDSRCLAATCLHLLGRSEHARQLLLEIVGPLLRLFGPDDPRTKQCQETLKDVTAG
ncbi:serine/threonine protein kinase [Actinomadura graeca]|uniref:non-specific serine/threonine protein kinase n=1 Tax=Actinomadura graeca TaxID=2750812 RepID=A0ABX8QZD6_9ACTN|nr:serine/threonine-protein kinase [Actinomadura graeca]QXJ23988.1 serine/threonine protein kinase [Actinomadura graeca]